MESTALSCLQALLSTGILLLENREYKGQWCIKPQPAPQCTLLTVCLTLLRITDFEPSLTAGTLCYIFFLTCFSCIPPGGNPNAAASPCLGWSRQLPGAGTAIPAGLLPPCLHSVMFARVSDAEVELTPLRKLPSCGDNSDLGRFAL